MKNAPIALTAGTLALLLFAGARVYAQEDAPSEREGSSRPPAAIIDVTPAPDSNAPPAYVPPAKPSAAIPMTQPAAAQPMPELPSPAADGIVGDELERRPIASAVKPADDPDAGIVTYVPSQPNELPLGALVKVRLRQTLSTVTTRPGMPFSGEIAEPLMRDGKVLIPEGSLVSGRVTMVRSGRRIGGGAAMHLEPRTVTLPDGSQYQFHARVIDTDRWNSTKVDSEGTIVRKSSAKATATEMSIATGSGAVVGAVVAGPPGALVGAGVGAGIGTIVWLKEDRQAELPKDLVLVFSLTSPMMVTPENALTHRASSSGTGE